MPGAGPPELNDELLRYEVAALAARAPLARMGGPESRRPGLFSWDGRLFPGEYVLAEVAAGGILTMSGPGEQVVVPLTQPAWVRFFHQTRSCNA
ncbi:MAG: hypothetical protein ACKPKO_06250, partial [Candidatus Fonsibacter sp.]